MPVTPLALTNTLIARHGATGSLDHMKLQKLCFFAYGWWLAYHQDRLLVEGPQVWRHGPVFQSLYGALRPFGSSPIVAPVGGPNGAPQVPATEDEIVRWVDWIWTRYGHLNALQLSDLTHAEGTPWQTEAAAYNYSVPERHVIPDERIRAYFTQLAANLR